MTWDMRHCLGECQHFKKFNIPEGSDLFWICKNCNEEFRVRALMIARIVPPRLENWPEEADYHVDDIRGGK